MQLYKKAEIKIKEIPKSVNKFLKVKNVHKRNHRKKCIPTKIKAFKFKTPHLEFEKPNK